MALHHRQRPPARRASGPTTGPLAAAAACTRLSGVDARLRRVWALASEHHGPSPHPDAFHRLLKPNIGDRKRQFAHRIDRTLALANTETRETLKPNLRTAQSLEHVHDPLDATTGERAKRIMIADRRTRQVDVLARFALARVLEQDSLFSTFKTDAGIESFWKLDDASRTALWGTRLDLMAIE
jgi:hypothetical protein